MIVKVSNEPVDLPQYDLQIGEEVSAGESFCPLLALTKFPYKYITAAYRNRVSASRFLPDPFFLSFQCHLRGISSTLMNI
jgi:hypothetical protein